MIPNPPKFRDHAYLISFSHDLDYSDYDPDPKDKHPDSD